MPDELRAFVMAFLESKECLGATAVAVSAVVSVLLGAWRLGIKLDQLDADVKAGFAADLKAHAEFKESITECRTIVGGHGQHLAALDERTEQMLLRETP